MHISEDKIIGKLMCVYRSVQETKCVTNGKYCMHGLWPEIGTSFSLIHISL